MLNRNTCHLQANIEYYACFDLLCLSLRLACFNHLCMYETSVSRADLIAGGSFGFAPLKCSNTYYMPYSIDFLDDGFSYI